MGCHPNGRHHEERPFALQVEEGGSRQENAYLRDEGDRPVEGFARDLPACILRLEGEATVEGDLGVALPEPSERGDGKAELEYVVAQEGGPLSFHLIKSSLL